jgi:D-alanine-D-alanine ligase-like ATP-grasp enzyme
MLFTGSAAVEKASEVIKTARPWFASTNIHLIANFESAVRQTSRDDRAFIAARADSEAKLNIAILRLKELGMSVSLYQSDADFLAGVSVDQVSWAKPIQLAYSGTKYSVIDGVRCLTPILCELRSIACTNSGVMGRALGWNKFVSTRVLEASGVPTPKSWHYRLDQGWKADSPPSPGMDLIIKNNTEAWGLGVSDEPVLRNASINDVEAKCREILGATGLRDVIVQEFIEGPEVYTPVFRLGADFLVFRPVQIFIDDSMWSEGKPIGMNLNRRQKHNFRPLADESLESNIASLAARAMDELEIDILSRMDFRIDGAGVPRLFDMAEVPGLSQNHAVGQSLSFAKAPFDGWELMMALNVLRTVRQNSSLEASVQAD